MELTGYLEIFRRRAALILLVTFLAIDAAAIATWLGPRTYEASALLQMQASSGDGTSSQDVEIIRERMPNYPPLVGSPAVVEGAARGAGMTVDEVSGRLSAVNPPGTTQLQITGQSGAPDTAARLADAAAEALADAVADQEPGPVLIRADLVVPASAPAHPASPKLTLNLAGGALAGLSLGMLAALTGGGGPRVLRGAGDVERISGLELLAQIPPTGGRHRGGAAADGGLRELTAALMHAAGGELPRVLLLSSCQPGAGNAWRDLVEGWAGHLAAGGRRVGVLETNTGPEAAPGATAVPGWTDLLAGGPPGDGIMVPVRGGQFTLVPVGGSADGLPASDLAARFGPMLHAVAASFDVLLVPLSPETPPLNSTLLAPAVSAAVVLATYCETADEQLDVGVLELQALGIPVLGVVMLDVPLRRRSHVLHLSRRPAGAEGPGAGAVPHFEDPASAKGTDGTPTDPAARAGNAGGAALPAAAALREARG